MHMRNFHIKSVILGIGIGIVITSIVSIIYTAGLNPLEELDEKDIDKLCSMYGLVRVTDNNVKKSDTIFNMEKETEDEADKNSNIAAADNADMDVDNKDKDIENNGNDTSSMNNETNESAGDNIVEDNKEQESANVSHAEKDGGNRGTANARNSNEGDIAESDTNKAVGNEANNAEKNNNGENVNNDTRPAALEPGTKVSITINRGDLPNEIGRKLYNKGLIDDIGLFNTRIRELGLTRKIIADTYVIKAGTSVDDILKIITTRQR